MLKFMMRIHGSIILQWLLLLAMVGLVCLVAYFVEDRLIKHLTALVIIVFLGTPLVAITLRSVVLAIRGPWK